MRPWVWGPHGLETIAAFFPAGDGAGTLAVCVCAFRDAAALAASLGSPQTPRVLADVAHFTDAKPVSGPLTIFLILDKAETARTLFPVPIVLPGPLVATSHHDQTL